MTKRLLFFIFCAFFINSLTIETKAQIKIGSCSSPTPNKNALLNLKKGENNFSSKKLLLPCVSMPSTLPTKSISANTTAMAVNNIEKRGDITSAYYCNDKEKWVCIETLKPWQVCKISSKTNNFNTQ